MKNIFLFFLMVVLIRSSYGQNCSCNITVYGDIQLTAKTKTDSVRKKEVYRVQQWLYSIIEEEFVVVEGFSQFPITMDSLLTSTISEIKKIKKFNPNKDSVLEYLKKGAELNVRKRFILEGEKKVFGGENDSLHRSFIPNPELASLPENLDLRSAAILENTIKVCKIYPNNNIAIIIGCNHLKWFKDRGYKVIDPLVFIR